MKFHAKGKTEDVSKFPDKIDSVGDTRSKGLGKYTLKPIQKPYSKPSGDKKRVLPKSGRKKI